METEKNVFNIKSAAKEYLKLKNEKALIEKRMSDLKPEIESFLEEQPEKSFEVQKHEFNLVHSSREFFDLKGAKENIDGRILKPYLRMSEFTQIRTVYLGEKSKKKPASKV